MQQGPAISLGDSDIEVPDHIKLPLLWASAAVCSSTFSSCLWLAHKLPEGRNYRCLIQHGSPSSWYNTQLRVAFIGYWLNYFIWTWVSYSLFVKYNNYLEWLVWRLERIQMKDLPPRQIHSKCLITRSCIIIIIRRRKSIIIQGVDGEFQTQRPPGSTQVM